MLSAKEAREKTQAAREKARLVEKEDALRGILVCIDVATEKGDCSTVWRFEQEENAKEVAATLMQAGYDVYCQRFSTTSAIYLRVEWRVSEKEPTTGRKWYYLWLR